MIHVGIDLHTNNMVIVAINGNGKVVREAKLPTATKALADFFSYFDESLFKPLSNVQARGIGCRTGAGPTA